jgi:hypothetical protein
MDKDDTLNQQESSRDDSPIIRMESVAPSDTPASHADAESDKVKSPIKSDDNDTESYSSSTENEEEEKVDGVSAAEVIRDNQANYKWSSSGELTYKRWWLETYGNCHKDLVADADAVVRTANTSWWNFWGHRTLQDVSSCTTAGSGRICTRKRLFSVAALMVMVLALCIGIVAKSKKSNSSLRTNGTADPTAGSESPATLSNDERFELLREILKDKYNILDDQDDGDNNYADAMYRVRSPQYQAVKWMASSDKMTNLWMMQVVDNFSMSDIQADAVVGTSLLSHLYERYAMVTFYLAAGGKAQTTSWWFELGSGRNQHPDQEWIHSLYFLTGGISVCDWNNIGENNYETLERQGVFCDEHGHIERILLGTWTSLIYCWPITLDVIDVIYVTFSDTSHTQNFSPSSSHFFFFTSGSK